MRWAPHSRVALLPRSRPLWKVPATRPSWYLPGRVPAALGQEGGDTWKHDLAAPCLAVRSAPTLSKHAGSSFSFSGSRRALWRAFCPSQGLLLFTSDVLPEAHPAASPLPPRIMRPDDANVAGNVHGGTILKMIEEAGAIISTRHCNSQNGVSVTWKTPGPGGLASPLAVPHPCPLSGQEGSLGGGQAWSLPRPGPWALGGFGKLRLWTGDPLRWQLVWGSARRGGDLQKLS